MSRKSPPKKKKTHGTGAKPPVKTPPVSAPEGTVPPPPAAPVPPARPGPAKAPPGSPLTHLGPALLMMVVMLAGFGAFLHHFPGAFWKQATGTITRVTVEETVTQVKEWSDLHRRYHDVEMPAWTPRVFYSYEVDGETYTASGPPLDGAAWVEQKNAEDWATKHPAGTPITVHYRRERPALSTLVPPASFLRAVMVLGAVLLVIVLAVFTSRPRRRGIVRE